VNAPEPDSGGGRYVVAFGTATYRDPALPELPGVRTDVPIVISTLVNLPHHPYEPAVFPTGLMDPDNPRKCSGR
jgi:hypothetical protein